jgi:hypothetical protein
MNDNFVTRDLCDERSKNIEKLLAKIDKSVDTLFNRLNWFYVLTIGALATGIASFISGCQ